MFEESVLSKQVFRGFGIFEKFVNECIVQFHVVLRFIGEVGCHPTLISKSTELFIHSSHDILHEYFITLQTLKILQKDIDTLLLTIIALAERVDIEYFHFYSYQYPKDSDDIAFILCADNGKASHLITYDSDLLEIKDYHSFIICKPLEFLKEIRVK